MRHNKSIVLSVSNLPLTFVLETLWKNWTALLSWVRFRRCKCLC